MRLDYNKKVMLKLVNDKPALGKTSVMKMMFILQQVFGMKMGYNFNIYTYGPYAAEVTDDLETLIYNDFVGADIYEYNNYMAYRLSITDHGRGLLDVLSLDDEQKITKVLSLFGDKKVKELELDTTIIYAKNIYIKNCWDEKKEDIVDYVHEIKPHFTFETIQNAYEKLENEGMLTSL